MKRLHSLTSISLATLISIITVSASWAGPDKKEMIDIKTMIDKSGITAQHAIKTVQKDYSGVIYRYELEDEDDVYYHEIKLIDIEADKKIKLTISIQTGEVVKKEWSRLFSWFFDDERILTARKLATMQYSMLDAINAINLDHTSIVKDIEVEDKQGILFFELETVNPTGETDWLVDANNNQLIPVLKK